jgi:hypothetical protein
MPMMSFCSRPASRMAVAFLAALGAVGPVASTAAADDAACIDAVEQALTLRKNGKLHDALKTLAACSDPSCQEEVRAECTQRIDAVGAAMPTLVFAARDGAGNDLYAVTVTMDGAPIATALDGRPLALDPGEHAFRFETAGQPPVDRTLVVREGEKNRIETVILGPAAPPPALPVASAVRPPAPPSTWNNRKTLAVVTGGVGVVGLGLGIAWSAFAASAQSQEQSNCSASSCPNRGQAVVDYNTAQQNATGATIGIVAGAALVAAGVVLWITAPSNAPASSAIAWHVAPSIVPSGGGLTLGGSL